MFVSAQKQTSEVTNSFIPTASHASTYDITSVGTVVPLADLVEPWWPIDLTTMK